CADPRFGALFLRRRRDGYPAQQHWSVGHQLPQSKGRSASENSVGQDAARGVAEAQSASETTKEKWWDAELSRAAGEVALRSPQPDLKSAQAHFERALAVARQQQAKSWELRAAMSLARLWRDQGKAQQARELLAPVYGWFTEGFDTRDLKEAKALLEELAP